MKEQTYKAPNGETITITDPNVATLLIREGFELVKPQVEPKKK